MTELFKEFQEFRKILCVCPCCGELVRVSDLKLRTKVPVARTWLDEYDKKSIAMDRKEERWDEREDEIRRKAVEQGRKEAEKAVIKAISPKLKAMKFDPFDVKAIFNPVDFVVFKGMTKKDNVSDILFLSKSVKNPDLNQLRNQVKKAILSKSYEWQVVRISEDGKIGFE